MYKDNSALTFHLDRAIPSCELQSDIASASEIVCFILFKHNILGLTLVWGWSGGAKVLSKLSVPGRPTSLYDSRARAYCACSRCGWGLF